MPTLYVPCRCRFVSVLVSVSMYVYVCVFACLCVPHVRFNLYWFILLDFNLWHWSRQSFLVRHTVSRALHIFFIFYCVLLAWARLWGKRRRKRRRQLLRWGSHWMPRSNHPAGRLRDCPLQTVGVSICIVGGLINLKCCWQMSEIEVVINYYGLANALRSNQIDLTYSLYYF